MILREIRHIFHIELDAIYGKDEVDSFFDILLEHFLDLRLINLTLNPNLAITKKEEQPLFEALSRLKLNEPIQYITGEVEFFGLKLKVNQNTLIPRPETEELVDWIINDNSETQDGDMRILDVGTGTGCIAIAMAKNFANAKVFAMDVSEQALQVARGNALWNKAEVEFTKGDVFKWEQELANNGFDIIVSNPPYVRNLEKNEIKNNVLGYEPHTALFVSDDDPLVFYRAILQMASEKLVSNGKVFFEINQYLGDEMVQLLESHDFKGIELRKDMSGNDRMLKAVKK